MSVAIYRCILRGIIKSHIKQELSYLLMSELIFVHEEGIFSIRCNYNDLHICWFPLDTLVIFIFIFAIENYYYFYYNNSFNNNAKELSTIYT